MSIYTYILKSLKYYRKQHLAVFAGALISTAVLTGALVVGDSVKYSLKHLVDVRLGNTAYSLQSGDRFFQSQLAENLESRIETPVSALLILKGIGVNPDLEKRINGINVLGINEDFGRLFDLKLMAVSPGEAMISSNMAQNLALKVGDEFLLRVEDANVIPLNAPFSQEEQPSKGLRLMVRNILDDENLGRFSLKSNQAAPFNVFLDREYLSENLGLGGLINTILVKRKQGVAFTSADLNAHLKKAWTIQDLGIRINDLAEQGKYEIQSNRIFIDDPIFESIDKLGLDVEPVLTYLVNSIGHQKLNTPYSFISAVSEKQMATALQDDEIIINDWLAADLKVSKGDTLSIDYFVIGPLRKLSELTGKFIVNDILETGLNPCDSSLMPDFPGLTEADNCSDWETGIPIDLDLIRDKDEFYWDDYKGTPKGLIAYGKGAGLWENDYGRVTALRLKKSSVELLELHEAILSGLNPVDLNLSFQAVNESGQQAANNSVDFGELFLSLSFFVILAGVLLTVLLYSLQTESRMMEAGVLTAMGYSKRHIVYLRFAESFFISLLGGVAGALVGLLYNHALITGLNSVWMDAVHTDVLKVYVLPGTMITGAISGTIIGLLAILIVSIRKLRSPVSILLKNHKLSSSANGNRNKGYTLALMILGFGSSIALLFYSLMNGVDQNAGLFLASGGMFMLGSFFAINFYLRGRANHRKGQEPRMLSLALINGSRNKTRSMTTIILFALGTFTIVITGANRKSFYGAENDRQSGTGGFSYWAETTVPLPYDLNSTEGRLKLGIENEELEKTKGIVQLMTLDGDDASCLNLNQVEQPRILGVDPGEFSSRNAFSFAKLLSDINPDSPWDELDKTYAQNVIPAYADQTVITWGLIKKIGDTLHYRNEAGQPMKLILAGGFNNSIFQGNLLISNKHFRENFPSASGSGILLFENTSNQSDEYTTHIEQQLVDYGINITSTRDRLAQFNSVENTYLSVFMILGGLGVILGTLGLGIVIVRNVLERKNELALMTAIGFQRKDLVWLMFLENFVLLLTGFITGLAGAVIGILPSFLSPAFTIPGSFMLWILLAVFASGMIWIWIPARQIARLPLVDTLRNE